MNDIIIPTLIESYQHQQSSTALDIKITETKSRGHPSSQPASSNNCIVIRS